MTTLDEIQLAVDRMNAMLTVPRGMMKDEEKWTISPPAMTPWLGDVRADGRMWNGRAWVGWTEPAITAEAATAAERARILAKLQAIKPSEQPYTRKVWNDELRGEMRMWERMVKALQGGEA